MSIAATTRRRGRQCSGSPSAEPRSTLPSSPRRGRADRDTTPLVTVIIAARPDAGPPPSVSGLRQLVWPRRGLEVLVARGDAPAWQRNAAVRTGSGEFLLFLDDDSLVTPGLLARHVAALRADPALGAVGGPAESLPGSAFQRLAAHVLGETWVMGRSSSRYRAHGAPREADERDLILCNLCIRRAAFEALGGFDEALYPNEENDFLERLVRAGWRCRHDPSAVVRRPQRSSPAALLRTVFGYGVGRAVQWRTLPSRISLARAALAVGMAAGLAAAIVAGAAGWGALVPAACYAGYLAAVVVKLALRAGPMAGFGGAALAAGVHGSYAMGVLLGLFRRPPRARGPEPAIERCHLPEAAGDPRRAA